ncbi:MAG: DNA gyrase subunit A [bacterium]|nr:DNA gyrase subunit A [bacterium]
MAEEEKKHRPERDPTGRSGPEEPSGSKRSDGIQEREITKELQESYLDYAMSVIVSRALPDVRDGLKPVHRRILWAMWDGGYTNDAKTKKSANIVGEVMGKYHPHGDIAIYDTLVRMAQDFSLRYPLIHGQGNWGSIDGDSAAAMRYTEAKLSKIAGELLLDIEKETVDWMPNYDAMREEPKVLPAKLPNLLLNGSEGIAVGMTTKIPPHNLGEIVDATVHLLEHPKASAEELVEFVKGPDFPTGGIIYDKRAITEIYATGKGAITMRAVALIVPRKKEGKEQFDIIITEIPYQVNKSELITTIAELVTEKKIEGIRDIRDESDRRIRIVIELKNDVPPQKILNQLYNRTDLERDFHVNMLALEGGGIQPRVMSLKDMLAAHIAHRQEVVRRRAEFDLKKTRERAHILEGLAKALAMIDKIIATIKKSADKEEAHKNLVKNFKLTDIQTSAILEMRLQTLAALERQKTLDELKEKKRLIEELELLLASPTKITALIKKELLELKERFGDERRTKVVVTGLKEFHEEDLIPEEETIITLSKSGYIKRVPPTTFKSQKRGGKGLIGSEVGEEDFLSHFVHANTHDNILFFTGRGRVFQTKVYEIPQGSRTSKGKAIHNFLEIPPEEAANAIVSYQGVPGKKPASPLTSGASRGGEAGQFVVMVTEKGLVKRTPLKDFANVRRNGIIAITLKKGDSLRWVRFSSGGDEIIVTTAKGQSIRFKETDVRPMGRTAAGVTGIRLKGSDTVSSMEVVMKDKAKEGRLLVVTQNGFGKHTALSQYKVQKRGGSGIKTAEVTAKTGPVVSAHIVTTEEELFAISAKGQTIRTDLKTVRVAGRATQGVKIMTLNSGDKVAGTICL